MSKLGYLKKSFYNAKKVVQKQCKQNFLYGAKTARILFLDLHIEITDKKDLDIFFFLIQECVTEFSCTVPENH